MQIGDRIGPDGTVEVLAVANIGKGFGVFLGKHPRSFGPEFIVSTFTLGQTTWHSGSYLPDPQKALDKFVHYIDPSFCVFQP